SPGHGRADAARATGHDGGAVGRRRVSGGHGPRRYLALGHDTSARIANWPDGFRPLWTSRQGRRLASLMPTRDEAGGGARMEIIRIVTGNRLDGHSDV